MSSEVIKAFLEQRRKTANSKHVFPNREELIDKYPWLNPGSMTSIKMFEQLEQYSGQSMNASEMANSIISSYNSVITEEGLSHMKCVALYGTLGMYARKITDDERVNRMVEEIILDARYTTSKVD